MFNPQDITVALFIGGWSAERQVSLDKSKAVEAALKSVGFKLHVIDVSENLSRLIVQLEEIKPDVVFNNLYGKGGEDGTIQAVLDMLGIPYTHSGAKTSAIAMDKPLTKTIAASLGINVADELIASKNDLTTQTQIAAPYVIKPRDEGSSVGIYMVQSDGDNILSVIQQDWPFGDIVMVEKYIPGEELTVAVLDGKAQAVTKIIAKQDFFDYTAKYQDTSTEYQLPADIPEDVYACALEQAEALYNKLGCRGIARCDFRYDDKQGVNGLYFLEINTQPGLTAESIGPSQVIYNGSSFKDLCTHLIETALCSKQTENEKQRKGASAD